MRASVRADAGTRTPDPFITSEVLYQLSYVGDFAGQCIGVFGSRERRAAARALKRYASKDAYLEPHGRLYEAEKRHG